MTAKKLSPHYNAGNGVTYTVTEASPVQAGEAIQAPRWAAWEHDDKAQQARLVGFYTTKKGAQAAIRRLIPQAKD